MKVWIGAARPRTLVASIVPVIVGTASSGVFITWRFVAALIVGLGLQIGVNFANDLFDAQKGVDSEERIGPGRATAMGLIAEDAMRAAMLAAIAVAAVAGLLLAAAAGWWLLVVGAAAIISALRYSGGKRPYGSRGLGELFVFVFFGVVATAGSAYVQTGRLQSLPIALSIPVGLFAVAILLVNNTRDIETDGPGGKATLAVRLGPLAMRRLYAVCVLDPFVIVAIVAFQASRPRLLLALPVAVLALRGMRLFARADEPKDWGSALRATAALQLIFGVAVSAALWI